MRWQGQERTLPNTEKGWREFYLPTKADALMARFNMWRDQHVSDAQHPYMLTPAGEAPEPPQTKEQILDRCVSPTGS